MTHAIGRWAALGVLAAAVAGLWLLPRSSREARTTSESAPAESAPSRSGARAAPPKSATVTVGGGRCAITGIVRSGGWPAAARLELRRIGSSDALLRIDSDPAVLAGPPLAEAASAADGTFAFLGLAPGSYQLDAIAHDDRAAETSLHLRPEGDVEHADLRLLPDRARETVRGRVIDVDGRPFRGWVGADCSGPAGKLLARDVPWTRCGEDGSFALTGLPAATIALRASRGEGSRLSGPAVDPARREPGEFRLADRLRPLEVRVASGAQPVAGARVAQTHGDHDAATADARGVALLAADRGAEIPLTVSAAGFVTRTATAAAGAETVHVAMEQATHLDVRVTDADTGAPAAGARVVGRRPRVGPGWEPELAAACDAEGFARFEGCVARDETWSVDGGGWVFADDVPGTAATSEGARTPVLHLRAVRPASIRGRVVAADGEPVRGATVETTPASSGPPVRRSSDFSATTTDADGVCVFDGLGPHRYSLWPDLPETLHAGEPTRLEATAASAEVRVTYARTATFRLLDAGDRPVRGVSVWVQCDGARWCSVYPTDDAGIVTHDGVVGTGGWITVAMNDRGAALLPFHTSWTAATHDIRLARFRRLEGIVVDWRGDAVADVFVRGVTGAAPDALASRRQEARTDAEGRFSWRVAVDMPVQVAAGNVARHVSGAEDETVYYAIDEPEWLVRHATAIPSGGGDVRVVLRRETSIEVRLDGWPEGRPLPETPTLVTLDGAHCHEPSDRGDRPMLFSGLDPDRKYAFLVRVPSRNLVGFASGLAPGESVVVKLEPGRTLTGRLRRPTVPGLSTTVKFAVGGAEIAAGLSDDGSFRVPCLPDAPGEVRVHGHAPPVDPYSRQFAGRAAARPGEPVIVEVRETR